MRLASATVGPFKSISNAQTVTLDQITVFVGMNEAGKTVFLQALQKSRDALNLAKPEPRGTTAGSTPMTLDGCARRQLRW